jgi:transcriptional regulator with XRE-family HTH domain
MDMQTFYRALGGNIRDLRMRAGITQEELGAFSTQKIGRATIANIEHGRQQVSAYQLQCFAEALHVSCDDLIPSKRRKGEVDKKIVALSKKIQDLIIKNSF